MFKLDTIFQEPLLEFGRNGQSPDIRDGIIRFGPVHIGTVKEKTSVRLGLVGTPKTVQAFTDWYKQCLNGISTDDQANQNFSPNFPGLSSSAGLRCTFLMDTSWVSEITENELRDKCKQNGATLALADLFGQHISGLFELSSTKPDVVICLPPEFVRKLVKPHLMDEDEDAGDDSDTGPDFHDYLKGLCVQTRSMFQLVWPRTYSGNSSGVQNQATRAWNLFCALFYKAGGIPWK